jgi:TonB-dependent SusC/RagA subfamily outer membrane receptor
MTGRAPGVRDCILRFVIRSACCLLLAIVACNRPKSTGDPPAPHDITKITAEDIDRSPGLSLEQLLVSRVPGLSLVRSPEGHVVIKIRGTTTLMGEEEPLYVVNGIPLDRQGGNLSAFDRRDIEYIQVLRDAASTAMYGARGANGVIVVKTKTP